MVSDTPNQTVNVAIRPEKIRISKEEPNEGVNCIQGKIEEIAYMGSLSVFRVRLPSGKEVRVTQPNFTRSMGDRLTWNDAVFLHWDEDSSVVLTS